MSPDTTREPFNPVENVHTALLSDLAAEQIFALIRSGQLAPGSRLPAERDLARRLGVSWTALREALRVVEAAGAVEASVGRGRFVSSNPRPDAGLPSGAAGGGWHQLHTDEVAELTHVLQLIEPAGVLEVPRHLLAEVSAEGEAICQRASDAIEAGNAELAAKLDAEFHRCLCNRTPNRLLRDIILGLVSLMETSGQVVYAIPAAARRSLDQHRAIIAALEAGERETASKLLRDHAMIAHRFAAEQAVLHDR
jgi:GntR family transcriptional regulator, transcriptional repressor for pyruvate dehydrogenase complex